MTRDYKDEGDSENGILADLSYQVSVLPQAVRQTTTAIAMSGYSLSNLEPPNLLAKTEIGRFIGQV